MPGEWWVSIGLIMAKILHEKGYHTALTKYGNPTPQETVDLRPMSKKLANARLPANFASSSTRAEPAKSCPVVDLSTNDARMPWRAEAIPLPADMKMEPI
jgi:hypothetical protein